MPVLPMRFPKQRKSPTGGVNQKYQPNRPPGDPPIVIPELTPPNPKDKPIPYEPPEEDAGDEHEYYCTKCDRNHHTSSNIGKAHVEFGQAE